MSHAVLTEHALISTDSQSLRNSTENVLSVRATVKDSLRNKKVQFIYLKTKKKKMA